jgi:ABC-type amino acid transport substrate-binding protein
MRRLAALLLTGAALAGAAAAPASAQAPPAAPTRTPGELVVGLSMPVPGFEVGATQGRAVLFAKGFEIDLAYAMAKQMGIPAVRFVQEDDFSTLVGTAPKDWDLALAEITITAQRRTRFDFTRSYLKADQGVLLRKGLTLPRRSIAGLRGLVLCAERGTTGASVVTRKVKPVKTPRIIRGLSRLQADLYQRKCDALVADAPQLGVMRDGSPGRYGPLVGRIVTGERWGAALPKGSPLTRPADAALAALIADGTVARISRAWLSTDVSKLPALR